jgi:hypothetical protein
VNSTVVLCWNSLQPCCSNTNIMINLEDSIVHSKQQLPAYFSIRDAGRLFLVEIRISITICTKRPRDQYIHSSCFLNKTKSSQNLRGRCVALLWKFKPKKNKSNLKPCCLHRVHFPITNNKTWTLSLVFCYLQMLFCYCVIILLFTNDTIAKAK